MRTVYQSAVTFAADIYDQASKWDYLLSGPTYANCYVGIRIDHTNKIVEIACRGTQTRDDGLKDIEAAVPVEEDELGVVAYGFFEGTKALYTIIATLIPLGYRVIIGGHSLGAAIATDLAAYAMVRFRSNPQAVPYAVILMGSPRPGCHTMNEQLRKIPVWYSFRNGGNLLFDPVTLVPTWGEHARELIQIHESPAPDDSWGAIVGYHHSELYLQGIAKLTFPPLVTP